VIVCWFFLWSVKDKLLNYLLSEASGVSNWIDPATRAGSTPPPGVAGGVYLPVFIPDFIPPPPYRALLPSLYIYNEVLIFLYIYKKSSEARVGEGIRILFDPFGVKSPPFLIIYATRIQSAKSLPITPRIGCFLKNSALRSWVEPGPARVP